MSIQLKASKIADILIKNYETNLDEKAKVSIKKYDEGYMNTCLEISLHRDNKVQQKFIGIFYNSNRYNSDEDKKRLEQAYLVAEYLDNNGIPCRTPIRTKSQETLIKIELDNSVNKNYFGLYKYLPGKTVPWESYTRRHLRALGLYTSQIHKLLSDYNQKISHFQKWGSYLHKDSKKLLKYFTKNQNPIVSKLGIDINYKKLNKIIEKLKNLQNEQIVHYDLVRGNILFSEEKQQLIYPITGILDFEKTMLANPIIDIARTYSFLLIDCKYKNDEEIKRYYFDQGYKQEEPKKGKLEIDNIPSKLDSETKFAQLVNYFWYRDLWKFLTSNPYESLDRNYHFRQTVDRLVQNRYVTMLG